MTERVTHGLSLWQRLLVSIRVRRFLRGVERANAATARYDATRGDQ